MKKTYWITLLLILLVLSCTAFIFSNSLKDQAASAADSEGIVKVVERVAKKIVPHNRINWTLVVRKGAHLFEFFLLGLCVASLAYRLRSFRWQAWTGSFSYALMIASCDELIQKFTGRGPAVADVMIDLLGASVGILLMFLLFYLLKRCRKESADSVL